MVATCLFALLLDGTAARGAGLPVAAGGWSWSNPVPQGQTLTDVTFVGARGYAVGEEGTVLRSDDAGRTWTELASQTRATLSHVQELDANTVLVAGDCALSESTDGGASFRRIAVTESNCTNRIVSFSILTGNTGFIELSDGEILFTSDGGRTVEARKGASGGVEHPGEITFLSSSTGFALVNGPHGAEIERTLDGANTWKTVATSQSTLADVTFVTSTTAYAVGEHSTLLRSTDGGSTWQAQPLTLPEGALVLPLEHIACADVLHCLIAVEARALGGTEVIRTTDGGATGSVVRPSEEANPLAPVLLYVDAVAFSGPSTVVATGEQGGIFLSDDAGATFRAPVYRLLEGIPNNRRLRLGQSGLDAYVALEGPGVAATTDGGLTWSTLRVPTSSEIVDFAFPSAQVGYAVNKDGSVFKTTTAGRTWAILGSAGAAPSALLAPDVNTVVVLRGGGVTRSTDGGASFKRFDPMVIIPRRGRRPRSAKLSTFDVSNGAELAGGGIFAFGDPLTPPEGIYTDSVLESADGGLHWSRLPSPVPREGAQAISFVSSTTGYELCEDRLFFTRNRGRTWKEVLALGATPDTIFPPVNLSFSSTRDGYVLLGYDENSSLEDTILATHDGGRSWVPQQLAGFGLSQVAAGGAVDYAIGEAPAFIFRTTSGGRGSASSALTLAIQGPRRVSAAKLSRSHGTVRLTGRLRPPLPGAQITIAYLPLHHLLWRHKTATVNARGVFSMTISGIRTTTRFVAQWRGTDRVDGAGTPATQLIVTR